MDGALSQTGIQNYNTRTVVPDDFEKGVTQSDIFLNVAKIAKENRNLFQIDSGRILKFGPCSGSVGCQLIRQPKNTIFEIAVNGRIHCCNNAIAGRKGCSKIPDSTDGPIHFPVCDVFSFMRLSVVVSFFRLDSCT